MKVYDVIREDSTIISSKKTEEEARECARKQSCLCSSKYYVREKTIECSIIGCYQLGKKEEF